MQHIMQTCLTDVNSNGALNGGHWMEGQSLIRGLCEGIPVLEEGLAVVGHLEELPARRHL